MVLCVIFRWLDKANSVSTDGFRRGVLLRFAAG
jgi:hypothetical protein